MDIDIQTMPELRVATVRHVGPYQHISEAFQRLGERAGRAGLIGQNGMMMAIYHDDPDATPPDELRSDAALVVEEGAMLPEGLGEARLPAGRYARATHRGAYARLGDSWARLLGEWLPASGHRLGAGKSYEVYRNTPMTVAEDALITELYVPIE